MSWRDVLGVANLAEPSYTQNPQNTDNITDTGNSADIVNCVESDTELLEAIATGIRGLTITPMEVHDALAPEDIDEWCKGGISTETLKDFAGALVERREMAQGKVPIGYTERATCEQCGPVWLWFSAEVLGCPWCFNRLSGRPIPRPTGDRIPEKDDATACDV